MCIRDRLTIAVSALGSLGKDVPFWIRLEYRILDGDPAPAANNSGGYTLQGLIDTMSRRRKAQDLSHVIEAGPFRLKP